ncbi:hypothetical protein [Caballeronia sp. LZ035]|uniref:hypothetical protein n=1 Tax=Caballeronia sp. LZ035 TaxID=3038568 RepID=UPI0028642097|nr:hypothetical protein [Caballeronia sp. LZ035]MDR5758465.1 hypothetical protein [Caballeronia sp. LZ035]
MKSLFASDVKISMVEVNFQKMLHMTAVELGMSKRPYEVEISRIDWSCFDDVTGSAESVALALHEFLKDNISNEELDAAYWKIENRVVVQGQLFSSAIPVTSVLVASLLEKRSFSAKVMVFEILYQILSGSDLSDDNKGESPILEKCHSMAREGLWLLYHELSGAHAEAALEILDLLELDRNRLNAFR